MQAYTTSTESNTGPNQSRQQAKAFLKLGQWEGALRECRTVLKFNPNDCEMYDVMGDALVNLERWDSAISAYKKALGNKPDDIVLNHKIAVVLSRLGKYLEIDEFYSRIFAKQSNFEQLNPNSFNVQNLSGEYFFRQQNWARAISAYQRAIEIDASNCWTHINLGRSLAEIENYPGAISTLKQAITLDDQNGWAYYFLAELLIEQESYDEALELCRQAILHMPDRVEPKALMDKINQAQFHIEGVHMHNSYASQVEGPPIHSSEQQPERVLEPPSQETEAPSQETTELPITPSPVAPSSGVGALSGWRESYEQGKQLQLRGDLEEAIKAYYQSIIKNPHYSWSYHDLGDVHLKLGNWHEAIAAYQQAIRLNPEYFWTNYNLGAAYRNIHDWQSTVELYKHSIRLNPGMNLPVRALEDTLKAWYDDLMKEGNQFLKTDKAKALDLYRRAIKVYGEHTHVSTFSLPREKRDALSVLLIADCHLDQCVRYRVQQKIEQLTYAGYESAYYAWTDITEAKNKIAFYDVVIFYRTPALTDIIKAIKYAKAINKVVFYEIDDLIFDAEFFPDPIESYGGQVSEEQYDDLVKGTVLFQEAMRLCDLAIASTPPLLKQIEKIVGEGHCYLHRNALDSRNEASLEAATPKVARDYISIFYGSGTKAHNSDFDELVAPALARILQQHPNVRLTLMGYLTVPEILAPYEGQIDRIPLVKDVVVYYEFLKQADIAIAVLHPTIVNNCKSELKWFEAASFKIPTVVSNTEVYLEAINTGEDGFIAANEQEWHTCLERLVLDEELRKQVGNAAYARVMQEYSLPTMAINIRSIISSGVQRHQRSGQIVPRASRKKLLIVNVFYPPQSIGGATRIVKDNVDVLTAQYRDDYDISVFTTDEDNPQPYQVIEYSYEGVPVTKVSTPMMEGMDWQYRNPRMYDIFKDYLMFNRPDLVHFHCVQRLTASVLEATADLGIPYLVTAHDAWWISDHQFLVNDQGQECDYRQSDPVVAARDARKLSESFQRKLYLRKQLNRAAEVLAVSETFSEIYRQNGFLQTKSNRNGINPKPILPRQPSESGRVRLAHIGGMAAHKGYFLFKEAVEKGNLSNTEVIVINHAQSPGTVEYGDWNGTPVTFLAKFKQEEINTLYSMVDVLVAPSMWPESFGLVTREAAATGVWVVTSDKGAIGEDISPGENGHICSVDSDEPLIKTLKEIDANFAFYTTRDESIKMVRTTQAQVEELNSLYHDILF